MIKLIADITKTFIAIASAFLLLSATVSPTEAISSNCELVRPPQQHVIKKQSQAAPQKPSPQKLPSPKADKAWTIGVLLPMTGKYSTIGQRFQRGLKLALSSDTTIDKHQWHLTLVDSAKTPPLEAIKQLNDDHATIILGPIQSKLAQSAAEKAIEYRLPIILWAPQPRLTSLGENVFQHFLSAANQAREMARFLQQRGEKRVAILHPDNNFGNEFKATLNNSCRNGKTTIVMSSAYNPHNTDFSSAIENLRDNHSSASDQQTPNYPFEALVIADFYPRLRLLVPQLTFHGLDRCQIYGTRGGNDCRLENEAGSDLEGAIFLDICLNLPKPPQVALDYHDLYLKTYQEPASIYDAYAYDSITILNQARQLTNNARAANLSEALLKLPPLKLVTGLTTVSNDGEFSKQLCPIAFKDKKRCALNESGSEADR